MTLRRFLERAGRGYGLAASALLMGFLASLAIYPAVPQGPGVVFLAALLFTAARAGTGPGIALTVVSSLVLEYFFFPPLYSWKLTAASVAATGAYAGVALMVGAATQSARHAQRKAELARDAAESLARQLRIQSDEIREKNRQLEEQRVQLQASLDELAKQDRFRNEFLAMLAHELRNPLSPILISVDILRARLGKDDRVRRPLEIIGRQSRHLARLVDDLLDVSRVTQGKIRLDPAEVDLVHVLHQVVDAAMPLIAERGHDLDLEIPDSPMWLQGDATRLVQVFSNLLTNAAKYTDPGGCIELRAGIDAGMARIVVRDNGRGIEAELLPYLFELFVQAERSLDRSEGGLGIGLSLARTLVQMHGGVIEARSAGLGHGAEFEVRLPLAPAATRAPLADPSTGSELRPTSLRGS